MDTTRTTDRPHINGGSREIERDIERTRHDMDHTLDQLGERLSPRHLLDDILDLFRSDSGASPDRRQKYLDEVERVGRIAARQVKQHPIPAILCGAGIAWLLYEQVSDDKGSDSSFNKLRRWSSGNESSAERGLAGEHELEQGGEDWHGVAAWHATYDWSNAPESESNWNTRADHTLNDISRILESQHLSSTDRIKLVAGRLLSLSGRKRRDLHSNWRNLREHSGSFVDARTGEPYSNEYGQELDTLMACDCAVGHDWNASDESRLNSTLDSLKTTFSDNAATTRDKLKVAAKQIRELVGASDAGAEYRSSLRSRTGRWMGRVRDTATGLGASVSSVYESGKEKLQQGWQEGRDRLLHSVEGGRERAGGGYQSARDSIQQGYQAGRERLHRGFEYGRDTVRQGRDSLQHGYEASRDEVVVQMNEHPLAAGAACLGVGLIAGLLIPETDSENRLMGQAARDLRSRAKEHGADMLQRGQHVVQAAAEASAEQLQKSGISKESIVSGLERGASQVLERGKEIAAATASAATEKMQEEGLTTEASMRSQSVSDDVQESSGEAGAGVKCDSDDDEGGTAHRS